MNLDVAMTPEEIRDRVGKRIVIASVSGGKDSTAMALHLREMGIPFESVFMDTGWEAPQTYEYLRGELEQRIGPIRWLSGDRGFEDLALWKGMMPSRTIRFCTQFLKVFPMQAYIRGLADAGDDVLNAVGIRAAESQARARLGQWEWSDGFDCETWRPILSWTESDVVAIHHRHSLRPNPLYLAGARRVGCYPCIFSSKAEIRRIAETDPERIERIRALERAVGDVAARAAQKRGDEPHRPSFFQIRRPGGGNAFVPIDDVINWSKTSRGGRQFDLFASDPPDAGCMRWGLCEPPVEEPED